MTAVLFNTYCIYNVGESESVLSVSLLYKHLGPLQFHPLNTLSDFLVSLKKMRHGF